MRQIKRVLGAATASLGLVMGLSGAIVGAQSGTIGTTGPDSTNKIVTVTTQQIHVNNDNNLSASNSNHQSSKTGKAEVEHNTTGGSATGGDASNANSFSASVTVDNSGSAPVTSGSGGGSSTGSITNTGPDSTNKIITKDSTHVTITNDNDLSIHNSNTQTATSGSAEVSGNTTGGSATSGDASNTSSASLTFKVTN